MTDKFRDYSTVEKDRRTANDMIFSAMTVDVEDGLNILMHDLFKKDMQPTERVLDNVRIILDLFKENNIRATFFILGEVASAFPSLIKEIASGGHELGVHGYYHEQFYRLTPQKAREGIYNAKSLVEDITGMAVAGFRAPVFSITKSTMWGLDVIAKLGFRYDSSIMPAKVGRYGWPEISKEIHRLVLPDGNSIVEVPMSVTCFLGKTIPACGGGYLRYFPYSFTRKAFIKVIRDRPVIVYLHPYELDINRYPDFFYEAKASLSLKKRLPLTLYRMNKSTVKGKLERLIKEFSFKPLIEIIDELEERSGIPVRYL